jgi:hypothetical protein
MYLLKTQKLKITKDWLVSGEFWRIFLSFNSWIFTPILGRFITQYTQGFFYESATAFIFQLLNKFLSQLIPTIFNADLPLLY